MKRKKHWIRVIAAAFSSILFLSFPSFAANASAITYYQQIEAMQLQGETKQEQEWRKLCDQMATGQWITYPEGKKKEFYRFYVYHYAFGSSLNNTGQSLSNGTIQALNPLDMDALSREVIEHFGVIAYPGDEVRTMAETWQRVQRGITYDRSYRNADFSTCLKDGRGVCWLYAQCFQALLNFEGIPCKTVVGTMDGGLHEWCRAYMNGKWIDLDPTGQRTPYLASNCEYIDLGW